MPDNTGRNSVGVGFMQLVTILMVSLRVMSSFLACALQLHAGEAYSAVLYARARAPVLKVEGLAPHDEPASRRSRLFLEDNLARSESRCYLYVSCLSSFTPRYVGVGLCGRGDPLTFTVSLRRASLVLRWKAVEVFFATLSFILRVFRYPAISAMSEVSVSSTVQFLSEYRRARSSAYPYCLDVVWGRSLMYNLKSMGASTDPWGTPFLRRRGRLACPSLVFRMKLRLERMVHRNRTR